MTTGAVDPDIASDREVEIFVDCMTQLGRKAREEIRRRIRRRDGGRRRGYHKSRLGHRS